MATTTFSGPIKAGTISNTTGTTVGKDMKNTGQVVMAQTHAIDLSGGALAAVATFRCYHSSKFTINRYCF